MNLRNVQPTGRYRFRQNRDWRGRITLVLQIQVRGTNTTCIAGAIDTEWVRAWRDAAVTDLEIVDGLPAFVLKQPEAA